MNKKQSWTKMVNTTKSKVPIYELINFDKEIKPKVSIIVPVYNVEEYLKECLDSLINQTLKDIEIICVNDGSTDGSLDVLKKYASKDTRVKIIDKDNAGYGHAMNIGTDMASGEFIGIVESDDYVDLKMYESLYNYAKETRVNIVKSNFNRFTGPPEKRNLFFNRVAKRIENYYVILNPHSRKDVFNFIMNAWTGLYKRQFLIDNKIRYNETPGASFQDNGFYFQTLMYTDSIYFVEEAFYFNRRDNENSSVMSNKKINCMKEEYDYIQSIINTDQRYSEFIPVCVHKRFVNYMFTYNRISIEDKLDYLYKVFEEYKQYQEKKLIDYSLFEDSEREQLISILKDPLAFHEALYSTDSIKISVIIPAYNESHNIDECINSVLSQSLSSIEVIVIDDGSTDDTAIKISNLASKDSRIKYFVQPNSGSGPARNKAIELSNGEYLAFMDADDYYPNRNILMNLYIAALNNSAMICGGSFSRNDNGKIITKFDSKWQKYSFTKSGFIKFKDYQFDYGYHRFIYSSKLIKDNKIQFPSYRRYQDPPFFIKAMIAAKQFYAVPQITYCYRKDNNKVKWTEDKVCDLLMGINDNLILSSNNNLEMVHYDNVMRINNDFLQIIMDALKKPNSKILALLSDIQSNIREDLIEKIHPLNERPFVIKPLYRMMIGYCNLSTIKEGDNLVKINRRLDEMFNLMSTHFHNDVNYDINNEITCDLSTLEKNLNSNDPSIVRQSFKLIEQMAVKNNVDAMICLGKCYRIGKGTAIDLHQSLDWLYKADEMGSEQSRIELFDTLWLYNIKEIDHEMIDEIMPQVKKDNPEALGRLARAYRDGRGVHKDLKKARSLYKKASKNNPFWLDELNSIEM